MAEISMNTAVVFNQLEETEGVLPGAFAATDAILIKSLTAEPLTGDRLTRDVVRPFFGANPGKLTATRGTMNFTTEATGAGVTALDAGTAPAYGRLLRQAGMAEVIRAPAATIAASPASGVGGPTGTFTYVADDPFAGIVDRLVTLECTTGGGSGVAAFTVSAPATLHVAAYEALAQVMTDAAAFALVNGATITPTVGTAFEVGDTFTIQLQPPGSFYTFVSTGFESGASFFQYGPNRHLFSGLRGNVTFNASSNQYYDLAFEMMGVPSTRSSEALPAVDFSAFQDPIEVNDVDTPFVSLGGEEIVLRSFSLNAGQNVNLRSLVGRKGVRISDRESTGSISFEALDLGTKDFFINLRDGDDLPFELFHGLTRGSIVHTSAPRLQLTSLTYEDEDGVAMFNANISAIPTDAGNDELTIAIK